MLLQEMEDLKSMGVVKKIGVSLYNSEQIDIVLSKFNIDLVQLPINIFDQQLLIGGWLDKLKDYDVEIHARSAFLQGLLLMTNDLVPPYFFPIKKNLEAFYKSVGAMPQNVNWAVKGAYASLLLPPTMEMNERPKSNPIANAKWSVVFIETE